MHFHVLANVFFVNTLNSHMPKVTLLNILANFLIIVNVFGGVMYYFAIYCPFLDNLLFI